MSNQSFFEKINTCGAAKSEAGSHCGLVARNGPDPLAQYIRSGPEGARGVLDFGAWSFSNSHFSALTLSHSHFSALTQLLDSLREGFCTKSVCVF